MEYTSRSATGGARRAHVNYNCPCSCVGGVIYSADKPLANPGRCCCGRMLMVGPDAEARLRSLLPAGERFELDVGAVTLPWGESAETALAVPVDGAAGH